ncbi:MAG: PilZ domain-containing protein [Deltaproteobacteria bacterium]|nr:PilZ domain-containing protein [Deltaproteobacteria bacterium]
MKKRFEIRRLVSRPIEIISSLWDEPLNFFTGDLSPRGSYVFGELMPSIGEHIYCSVDLGLTKPIEAFAEVVRANMMRRSADVGYPGFGLDFVGLKPLERIKIRNLLRGLPAVVPMIPRIGGPMRSSG